MLCVYHQQFFCPIRSFKRYAAWRPALMISRSRDGELIAGVARRTGWHAARGSSSRGGAEALHEMVEHVAKHRLAVHIVDGPRGPAGVVKAGAIRLAQATGASIVPFYVAADRAWYGRGWDRFLLPKPLANVVLRFGSRMEIPRETDETEFENLRRALEQTMAAELAELRRAVERPEPPALMPPANPGTPAR